MILKLTEWDFFATRHGKSIRDGIGGTAKRITAKYSWQQATKHQILKPCGMYQLCKEFKGIAFMFIREKDMVKMQDLLEDWYVSARTLLGTRSFHQYTPLTATTVGTKRVSQDETYAIKLNFQALFLPEVRYFDMRSSMIDMCIFDNQIWIGMVTEEDIFHEDALLKFTILPILVGHLHGHRETTAVGYVTNIVC